MTVIVPHRSIIHRKSHLKMSADEMIHYCKENNDIFYHLIFILPTITIETIVPNLLNT
jgi:hypothetical protein